MSHLRFYRATLFAIKSQRASVQMHAANQTNMTDYDIRANRLVLVGCLAKLKRTRPIEELRKD